MTKWAISKGCMEIIYYFNFPREIFCFVDFLYF